VQLKKQPECPLLFLDYPGCLFYGKFASDVLTSPTALVISYYAKMTKLLQIHLHFLEKTSFINVTFLPDTFFIRTIYFCSCSKYIGLLLFLKIAIIAKVYRKIHSGIPFQIFPKGDSQ